MMMLHHHERSAPRSAAMTNQGSRTLVRRLRRVVAALAAAAIAIVGLTFSATPAQADDPAFISTWVTGNTSAGSSANNQITLPLTSAGTYEFTVDWGDGSTDLITTFDQAEATHTYASPGTKTVTITGTISGFAFANSGDRLKITDISAWGPMNLGNGGSYFAGAANLTISAVDAPVLTGTTNMSNAFLNATALTGDLSDWDVSGVTNMRSMFQGASSFDSDLSTWNVGSATTMRSMFQDATAFTSDVAAWDVADVTTMRSMFSGAESFDRNLGAWDVSSVFDMTDMFSGGGDVGLSLDNYDALLTGWSALPVQPGVDFDAGNSYYNPTTTQAARDVLTDSNSWTILDSGPAAVPSTPAAPTAVGGSQQAVVTWTAPSANHSEITGYTVTSSPGGFTCTTVAPELTCTVTGLTNDTSYTFRVTATNAVGTSAASSPSNTVIPRTSEPAAPAQPFAEALNESARVWVSAGTGGGTPDTYEVTATPGGTTCEVVVPATSCVISGLSNVTEYTFAATATNEFGTSPTSVDSNAITPSQPMVMSWDTTRTSDGSTGSNQIRLPLVSDGTYNFTVSWGTARAVS